MILEVSGLYPGSCEWAWKMTSEKRKKKKTSPLSESLQTIWGNSNFMAVSCFSTILKSLVLKSVTSRFFKQVSLLLGDDRLYGI